MKKKNKKAAKRNRSGRNRNKMVAPPPGITSPTLSPGARREQDTGSLLQTLKHHPHDSKLRMQTAIASWRQGKETEAIATLHDGLRIQAQDSLLAYCLGMLFAEKEQFASAQEWLHRAVQWDDQHVESYYYLGLTYAAQHKFDSAFQHMQKAAQLRPGDKSIREALNLAGQCLQKRKCSTQDRTIPWVDGISMDPLNPSVDTLTDMIVEEADYVQTFLNNTTSQENEAELKLLLEALDQAIDRFPNHADLHYYRGVVLHRMGQIPLSVRSLRRSLRINNQYKEAFIFLAKLYHNVQRHQKAIQTFRRAIQAGAKYADVYLHLGQSYQKTGQTESARSAYETALRINHQYRAAQEALASLAA
jgi:tetratricopeptide (TPR) repeat protein